MIIDKITFGSDPEFAIRRISGEIIPSNRVISGTKENPTDILDGFTMFKDNLLVEGNVPPTTTKSGFISSIITLKNKINNELKSKECSVFCANSVEYLEEDTKSEESQEIGCSNYLNAWCNSELSANFFSKTIRGIGGHVHIGYTNVSNVSSDVINVILTKLLDVNLGIPCKSKVTDIHRSNNYGMLGSYRETKYGMEYRVLGGHWMSNSETLAEVYDGVIKSIEQLNSMSMENLKELYFLKVDQKTLELDYIPKQLLKLKKEKLFKLV